jgi:hypothetical protein
MKYFLIIIILINSVLIYAGTEFLDGDSSLNEFAIDSVSVHQREKLIQMMGYGGIMSSSDTYEIENKPSKDFDPQHLGYFVEADDNDKVKDILKDATLRFRGMEESRSTLDPYFQ